MKVYSRNRRKVRKPRLLVFMSRSQIRFQNLPEPKISQVGCYKGFIKIFWVLCLVQEMSKTEVFCWNEVMPQEAHKEMKIAGSHVNGIFQHDFFCYGIPVGKDEYVKHMLIKKVEEITEEAKKVVETLEDERQALWSILRLSIAQQLDYWCQFCYPYDIFAAAGRMDEIEWEVLQVVTGSVIPRGEEVKSWSCVPDVPIDNLRGKSYQEWLVI